MVRELIGAEDIALVEHEVIKSMNLLEGDINNDVWYLTGVHDMAEKLMLMIEARAGKRNIEEQLFWKKESGGV